MCHLPDLNVCMSKLTAFVFYSKPPCILTVEQVAACLPSWPFCNYLHSHFRQLMRPHCFLMEQPRGLEQVRQHSLSCDFWGIQEARCVNTPEPDVWGGMGRVQPDGLSPDCGCHTSMTWIWRGITRAGTRKKKEWDGRGRVGKSNGFCFVFLWWM